MLKRIFDIIASSCGLFLLSPVIAIVAWKISRKLGSPLLFRQVRPGIDGKPFEMVKFRTMLDAVDTQELPELWNVFKGDMSLVGPRPLLIEYIPLYSQEQYRRHEVRPGVTGWAQINGRNAISWENKFELDIWYVDNRSLWLDIKIILLTIKKVLVRDGISADGEVTMTKFTGSNK
jgi:lipopolysaccharide/colanic/teichoic acid biosynthesis glycosyltransferase